MKMDCVTACAMKIICPNPNCGYRGPSTLRGRGSITVFAILASLAIACIAVSLAMLRGFTPLGLHTVRHWGNCVIAAMAFMTASITYLLRSIGYRYECPRCKIKVR